MGQIEELEKITEQCRSRRFPWEEWRMVAQKAGDYDDDFRPDMSNYKYLLWSPCSAVGYLSRWTQDEIERERAYHSVPLKQRLAKYQRYFSLVSEEETPSFFAYLAELERMREMLVQILTDHQSEQATESETNSA